MGYQREESLMDSQANHARERRRLRLLDRTISHPIRSTILAAIAAALATIALVLASSDNSALAASSLVNGNFETGDLTGWSLDTTNGGTARAVPGYAYYGCGEDWWCGHVRGMETKEGSYFALLQTGKESEDTIISQPFEASNGDKISGWVFLYHNFWPDYQYPPYSEDKGQVVIKSDSGTTLATPFQESVIPGGHPYWKYWEYTFSGLTGTDAFQIEARIQRSPSSSSGTYSHMGLDDVKTTTAPENDTTKPSTGATSSVEPNAAGWNKQNVTVRLNATDNQGGSGVQKITYSASGAQRIAQTDATGDSVVVALDQEGTTTLTYYATDKAGNVEDQKSLTIKIDKSAPTGSVTINDGASRTRSRSVTLSLSATDPSTGSGVSRMRISNTQSGLSSATWEAYSTTKAWSLSSGQGTKTVYVEYRDRAGNRSAVVTDTIRFAR
jgi:hypothetical protein